MKILLALSYAPYPVRRGIDRLVVNLIRALSARHDVSLVTMAFDREGLDALEGLECERVKVRAMLAPNKRSAAHRALYKAVNHVRALVTGVPVKVLYATPRPYIDLIAKTVEEEDADLVLASYWHHYDLPAHLPGRRCVLVTYDIDYLIHGERLRYTAGGARAGIAGSDARRRERIEKTAYRNYGAILTVTKRDAAAVREFTEGGGALVRTLPLGIDLGRFRPGEFTRRPGRILFLGALDSDFNRDALLFFTNDVLPRILERFPEAVVEVVGGEGDRGLLSLGGPSVRFLGRVDDIIPHLGRCVLMVLPLRFGGGVRIRMMEAASMAVPVVSTSVGVAGMGLVDGRDYIEADGADDFADAVLGVLADGALAERIGRGARLWAERSLSMETYPDRLDRLLGELVTSRSNSSI